MLVSERTFRTGVAAELAGFGGPAGLRTLLHKLREKGSRMGDEAERQDPDDAAWRWKSFGFADVCTFRLAKILTDAGIGGEIARQIASDPGTRTHFDYAQRVAEGSMEHAGGGSFPDKYAVFPIGETHPNAPSFALVRRKELDRILDGRGLVHATGYSIVSLDEVRREMLRRIAALEP